MESERSEDSKPATPLSFQEHDPSLDLEQEYEQSKEEAIPIREARELALLNEADNCFEPESPYYSPVIPQQTRRASRLDFLSEPGFEQGPPLSAQTQPQTRLSSPLAPQARPIPRAPSASFPTSFEQGPIRSPNTAAREWTRTVQPYSVSPGNLINLSESPQAVPPCYEEKSLFAGYQQTDRHRTAETQHSQSISPPTHAPLPPSLLNIHRRALSGQSQVERRSMFDDDRVSRQQNSNNSYARKNSGYSQFTDRLRTPPQHTFQAQPPMSHLYGGAPDINLEGGQRTNGLRPGERGYYVGFDNMSVIKGGQAKNLQVVLAGYEGGLNVRHVSKRGSTQIAQLGGLRGGVYAAKILPWTIDHGLNTTRGSSLVCLVVHGPVLDDGNEAANFGEEAGDELGKRRSGSTTGTEQRRRNAITHYQTTVEVYDLRTQRNVATLLTLPKVELLTPYMGPRFTPPPPTGALVVAADSGSIVITSGQTGELWVFRQAKLERDAPLRFKCLGKFWTTVQQQAVNEAGDSSHHLASERIGGNDAKTKKRSKTGLISLRGRWLAYCPSPNIHAISLRAVVDISRSPKSAIASINSYAPPQQPSANCAVDTPPGDSLTSRLGRQAAQGAIVGANFIAEKGTKVWNSYWKPPTQTQAGWSPGAGEPAQMFPPTHGSSSGKENVVSEAVTVSIVDLHKLGNLGQGKKMSAATVASFRLLDGCSYLSLSPSGLQLCTANGRGDRQFIWDLLRMQYLKPSPLTLTRQGYPITPHIRQIYRFERLTASRIVDVVWALPGGKTIAMVTERNTVHFFEVPAQVFAWPPPRRVRPVQANEAGATRAVSAAPAVVANLAVGAFSTVRGFAGWGRQRGGSQTGGALSSATAGLEGLANAPAPNRSGALAGMITSYAGQGAKMARSGISKGLSSGMQTVQQLRRAGDNRLHLPAEGSILGGDCVMWLGSRRRRRQAFGVLLEGVVMVHVVQYIKAKSGGKGRKREPPRVVNKGCVKDVAIPSLPDSMMSEMVRQYLGTDDGEMDMNSPSVRAVDDNSRTSVLPVQPLRGNWRRQGRSGGTGGNSIPMAEIETSTPYQPFANDWRVGMFTYADDAWMHNHFTISNSDAPADSNTNANRLVVEEPWSFGGTIAAERLDCGFEDDDGDEERGNGEGYGYALERTVSREGQEPIISTTRRRHRNGGNGGEQDLAALGEEEEEGFFEDELEWVDFAGR